MTRGSILAVTCALCGLAAVVGWRLGQNTARLTETEAILSAAVLWQRATGGDARDCAAIPDPDPARWLTVHCRNDGVAQSYTVDRAGRIAPLDTLGT